MTLQFTMFITLRSRLRIAPNNVSRSVPLGYRRLSTLGSKQISELGLSPSLDTAIVRIQQTREENNKIDVSQKDFQHTEKQAQKTLVAGILITLLDLYVSSNTHCHEELTIEYTGVIGGFISTQALKRKRIEKRQEHMSTQTAGLPSTTQREDPGLNCNTRRLSPSNQESIPKAVRHVNQKHITKVTLLQRRYFSSSGGNMTVTK